MRERESAGQIISLFIHSRDIWEKRHAWYLVYAPPVQSILTLTGGPGGVCQSGWINQPANQGGEASRGHRAWGAALHQFGNHGNNCISTHNGHCTITYQYRLGNRHHDASSATTHTTALCTS
jgi:hypothetical protein